MKSYLQHLENNEAILLMYLSGELPEADRQEVEQMLASDATLRGELDILRRTQELAFDALGSLDELTRPVLSAAETQSRMSRLISGWLARRREAAVRALAGRGPMPWRRITFAAAAMLLVGYYVWAVYDKLDQGPPKPQDNNQVADDVPPLNNAPPPPQLSADVKEALLSNSLEDSNSDESALHVAEVAAVVPSDMDSSESSRDSGRGGSNQGGSGQVGSSQVGSSQGLNSSTVVEP